MTLIRMLETDYNKQPNFFGNLKEFDDIIMIRETVDTVARASETPMPYSFGELCQLSAKEVGAAYNKQRLHSTQQPMGLIVDAINQ
jgi:hypothetical protein